jgi:hypothetical protein
MLVATPAEHDGDAHALAGIHNLERLPGKRPLGRAAGR